MSAANCPDDGTSFCDGALPRPRSSLRLSRLLIARSVAIRGKNS